MVQIGAALWLCLDISSNLPSLCTNCCSPASVIKMERNPCTLKFHWFHYVNVFADSIVAILRYMVTNIQIPNVIASAPIPEANQEPKCLNRWSRVHGHRVPQEPVESSVEKCKYQGIRYPYFMGPGSRRLKWIILKRKQRSDNWIEKGPPINDTHFENVWDRSKTFLPVHFGQSMPNLELQRCAIVWDSDLQVQCEIPRLPRWLAGPQQTRLIANTCQH